MEAFDEDLRTRAVGRLGTERMLRRAIGERRLRLQYQPIFDLPTPSDHVELAFTLWAGEVNNGGQGRD